MGALVAKRRPRAAELLEDLEGRIRHIEEYRSKRVRFRDRIIPRIVIILIIAIIICFALYYFFEHPSILVTIICLVTIVAVLIIICCVKRILQRCFSRHINEYDDQLRLLNANKRAVLEEVKETENYRTACDLLQKYDN